VSQPAWLLEARALEQEGKLEAMQDKVRDAVDHLSFAAVIAQIYSDRMVRLQEAGDAAGAADAYERATNHIYFYASMATSGGEGTALSAERDEFLRELRSLYQGAT
jgi:hypothetical protein